MSRPVSRSAALIVVAVALVAGCAGQSDSRSGDESAGVDWSDCGAVECATLQVPLDRSDPDGLTIRLALARRPAQGERVGILLVNPGGPGAQGLYLAEFAHSYLDDAVLEHFDIIAWDPRGVGISSAVDCVDDQDWFWAADRTPDDAAEVREVEEVSRRFAQGCEQRSAALLAHMGSDATVEDMDAIRAALGEDRLSYVGYSYGTYLGALYAQAHPKRVRAMVLDGAVDPALDANQALLEQAAGFERSLDAFLDWCGARSDCQIGVTGDPVADLDALLSGIDDSPVPAGSRSLGPGEADIAIASGLYAGSDGWTELARALEQAATGDGTLLLSFADAYTGRRPDGSYSNENEAFYATSCIDAPGPSTTDEVADLAREAAAVAPHLGPASAWLGLVCAYWPVPPAREPGPIEARGAPAIVVLATTGDPATPASWGRSLADQLDSAVLVTLDDEGHIASGRANSCIDAVVADYLTDLEVPPHGTTCEAS